MIGGSLMMALGALAISASSATAEEYASWKEAARRETELYGINPEYVTARMKVEKRTRERSGARGWTG